MRCNLNFHTTQHTGYGRFGLELSAALENVGVQNLGATYAPDDGPPEGESPRRAEQLAAVALYLSTPPHLRGTYKGQLNAIFTMWESSSIPAGFRENLDYFDRIFVPSEQNRELFSRYHPDVRYVPLGVGQEWQPIRRQRPSKEFVFLTAGTGPRKNMLAVAAAFQEVFSNNTRKTRRVQPVLWTRGRDEITGPNIRNITFEVGADAERALYASAHCFVSASRGEGWGLMPAQAIASGCPTILPYHSGHAAFAKYGIPYCAQEVECGHHTFWGDGGTWWEPDHDALCLAMWAVYRNYEQYAEQAWLHSQRFWQEFTWEQSAQRLVYNLPELFDEGPQAWDWQPAEAPTYLVRVTRAAHYTINGVHHFYAPWDPADPSTEYWETAEMKVMLSAGGYLHASCIDPLEMGERVGTRLLQDARNATCPTCNRKMNE